MKYLWNCGIGLFECSLWGIEVNHRLADVETVQDEAMVDAKHHVEVHTET